MQIDLSTQQICEGVKRSLGSAVTLTQVVKLWHSVGTIIRAQLEQRKGVKLDHFGSFNFDILGEELDDCVLLLICFFLLLLLLLLMMMICFVVVVVVVVVLS